ncbi:hypothetical protein [Kitasatospora sp. NPDC047058]|uniref:hypothetical protein n=1 Tax=Kitasatospora sp. NPDC047058 TaxID=3155620 RepID=UPI0033E7CA01
MRATCPQCATPDESVPVPQALTDPGRPLDEPLRALLAPPPEPPPIRIGVSGSAVTLFSLAGGFCLLGVLTQLTSHEDLDGFSDAYRLGYRLGPYIIPALLLVTGLIVQVVSRRSRTRKADSRRAEQWAYWKRYHQVWQAGWLCRRCGVAFFPAAAVHADQPASPPVAVDRFAGWVAAAATAAPAAGGPYLAPAGVNRRE